MKIKDLLKYEPCLDFIREYSGAQNAATGSKVDANANVDHKNIATLANEIPKQDLIAINRLAMHRKLTDMFGEDVADRYLDQLDKHLIYRHDESHLVGTPYCVSITMYPFLFSGLKGIGGTSAAPQHLHSFCGSFVNLVFAIAAQFAGAVSTPEFLAYMDYFIRKDYGDDYYLHPERIVDMSNRQRSIDHIIADCFDQVVYSINQPAAARGNQAVFWNIAYFDYPYFEGMFAEFVFPDGTGMQWESVSWLQKRFMKWFNQTRLKVPLTFPVETMNLLDDGMNFVDTEWAEFTAEMLAEGHSFFIYHSNTVDSLASCCFAPDTPIAAKCGDNIVHTSIGKFYEMFNGREDVCVLQDGKWQPARVISAPVRPMYEIATVGDRKVIVTDNHLFPVATDRETADCFAYVLADDLTTDDSLWIDMDAQLFTTCSTDDGECRNFQYPDRIKSIRRIEDVDYDTVYCFEMKDQSKPYFTLPNGIITHNCRLRNELQDNTFSYTLGAGGVSTGSKCVISMNINRLVQNASRDGVPLSDAVRQQVDDIHKYLLAVNDIIKEAYHNRMLPVYDAEFIALEKQYLTVGINGFIEGAEFLGIAPAPFDKQYEEYCQQILKPIYDANKALKTDEIMINTEFVPAENLGVKFAAWDRRDGYVVPRDCYNSYFYRVEDENCNVLDKLILHGKSFTEYLDGGSACHINLDEHLSKAQYMSLMRTAVRTGCPYFTFNIPNTVCNDCGHISKHRLTECPKCGSHNLDYLTRVIGYLKRVSAFSEARQQEEKRRYYAGGIQ